jgi:hypothetical protein
MIRAALPSSALVFFGAYLLGMALSSPLRVVSRDKPQSTRPNWVVGNLTFTFGNVTGEGNNGFPTYADSDAPEEAPRRLLWVCWDGVAQLPAIPDPRSFSAAHCCHHHRMSGFAARGRHRELGPRAGL